MLGSKGPPIGNGIWGIKSSRDRRRHVTDVTRPGSRRHVTPKGQTRDLNTLRAQYLENSWSC